MPSEMGEQRAPQRYLAPELRPQMRVTGRIEYELHQAHVAKGTVVIIHRIGRRNRTQPCAHLEVEASFGLISLLNALVVRWSGEGFPH